MHFDTFQGEEIGMTDVEQDSIDPRSRSRSPFQWDNTTNAGFSTNPKTWLRIAENYSDVNVELQQSLDISHLKVFQQLISLRNNPTLKYGTLTFKSANDDNLLVYKREMKNDPSADIIVVALNLSNGKNIQNIDLELLVGELPAKMKIIISSVHSNRNGSV